MPAYALEAEIELPEGCDPRAVGAAVTVELCGHWEHEGPRVSAVRMQLTTHSVVKFRFVA
jgi:hypothetical protein